jgi:L-serine dehydratase
MDDCINRSLATDGTLPGGLNVRRRARAIHQALLAERGTNLSQPHVANDWLSVYAMAVNKENAAGSRVVGRDMSMNYKETSTGGLAVNLPEC